MLQTVTITPKYVNPPKTGKKYGTIKTADGMSYAAQHSVTSKCQPGQPVTIEWEGQDWSGSPVMVVSRVVAAPQQNGTQHGAPPSAPPPTEYPDAPRGTNGYVPTWTDRQIFVCGLAQRMLGSGHFNIGDIEQIVLATDSAYDALLRKHGR